MGYSNKIFAYEVFAAINPILFSSYAQVLYILREIQEIFVEEEENSKLRPTIHNLKMNLCNAIAVVEKFGWLIGWLVGWFYGIATLFGSFNAELNFKQFSLV